MHNVWEQAFTLMADHGQPGACQIVVDGMRKVPAGHVEEMMKWEAIADCLNAIADAATTKH